MIWLVEYEKIIVLHAIQVHSFDVVCRTTTWDFDIWSSDDNATAQQQIFHSLPLLENHFCQARESVLRILSSYQNDIYALCDVVVKWLSEGIINRTCQIRVLRVQTLGIGFSKMMFTSSYDPYQAFSVGCTIIVKWKSAHVTFAGLSYHCRLYTLIGWRPRCMSRVQTKRRRFK